MQAVGAVMRRKLQAMIFNPDIQFIKTMKKLITFAVSIAALVLSSCKYNDNEIWNSVHGLEDRVAKLEELCKQINTNISSLQTIVTALQGNDYVTGVTPVMQSGKEIGYTITFSKSSPITIFHGKDGENAAPVIGVKNDTDGIYYWTLNGEWLTDTAGSKIKAEGTDGKDGADGEDGENGTTPQFKIENDYWFISYDNGDTWKQLGKATGDDGKDGVGGDTVFTGVDYKTSGDYVIFTLADGTQIKLPTWSAFEALQRLYNQTNTNLSALQTIVTALQNNDWITGVDPLTENGKIVGYTIKFAKSNPIVIYNGKDGADGMDGNTPVIGVKEDEDGIYYWTLNGEFIIADGQKVQAQGTNGGNGSDGKDGVTPQLKIENGYWFISYDNGVTWTQLDKATGEDGKDGADGKDGEGITVSQDEGNVYFTLPDGTVITISKTNNKSSNIIFADTGVKKKCIGLWDTNGDGELSYDEAAAVTTIGTVFQNNTDIEFFSELKHFSGLTALEANAFNGCSNLCSITIPSNVATIDVTSFKGCSQLMQISFDKNSCITTFEGNYKENSSSYGSGSDAPTYSGIFSDCVALKTIQIPASVKEIKACAFKGCINLSCVTFEKGSNLQIIGGGYTEHTHTSSAGTRYYYFYSFGAFDGCKSLTSIEIPNSVTEIGICAFSGCAQLQTVTFQKGIQIKTLKGTCVSDGEYRTYLGVFKGCSLSSIEIPASIEIIEPCAFAYCTNMSVVTFEQGSKLKEFADSIKFTSDLVGAFVNCTSLKSILIPANVEKIGSGTFVNCTSLSTVTFEPNSNLKIINEEAFTNCAALTNIKFPNSVTSINRNAFSKCQKLIDIYCAALVPPTIYYSTFKDISSAARFYVPIESVDTYKVAADWKTYADQIVGYDFNE